MIFSTTLRLTTGFKIRSIWLHSVVCLMHFVTLGALAPAHLHQRLDNVESALASQLDDLMKVILQNVINEQFEQDGSIAEHTVDASHLADELLKAISRQVPLLFGSDPIPKLFVKTVQSTLSKACREAINAAIEQESSKILDNDVRHLADLPMASAHNAPVQNRMVGPQSASEWYDDSNL